MDFRQLETFVKVASLGNFTRAAEALSLSQPAVTRQVAALEKQAGTCLLDRLGHTVALTPAGEVLYRYATEILRLTEAAQEEVSLHSAGELGRLRLGCSTTAAAYFLPPVLARFRAGNPHVELQLQTGGSAEIESLVETNVVDLGIVMDYHLRPNLTVLPVTKYQNLVVVHPSDNLARKRAPVTFEALASHSWLVTRQGTRLRGLMEAMFPATAPKPHIAMELDNLETIKRMVQAHLGVALLPKLAVAEELASGSLIALKIKGYRAESQSISALHRRDKYLTHAIRDFLHGLRDST